MQQLRGIIKWWLFIVPEAVLLYAALFLSLTLRYHGSVAWPLYMLHTRVFTPLFIVWTLVLFVHNLFEVETFRRYTTLIFKLLSAMGVNSLIAVVYFYFQPQLTFTPRRVLLVDALVSFLFLLAWNLLSKALLRRQFMGDIYLFSFTDELAELESEIARHDYLGFRVKAHLRQSDLPHNLAAVTGGARIIVPDNLQTSPEVITMFYQLRKRGVLFHNNRDFYEWLVRRVYLSELNELWFLENIHYKEKRFYNFIKRVIDLALGIIGLVVFAVTLPFIALLIKLTTKGPIFFTQRRVGRGGRTFRIYKYKTMAGGATDTWTQPGDPRITPIGNFLRKTRLDEMPQFINLLIGDVSMVGPRPEQEGIVEKMRQLIPFYDERHIVKPGITGWAQLHTYAGSLEETKVKLQYDLYYVKHRSILFDLEIIIKTVYHVFTWSGR